MASICNYSSIPKLATMDDCAMSSVILCLLLLVVSPRLGSSYRHHTTYKLGASHVAVRSPDDGGPTPTTYCSAIPSGDGGGIAARPLAVLHRLSPCSPHGAGLDQSEVSLGDALRMDGRRLHALFREDSTATATAYAFSPAPAPAASTAVTVPSTGVPSVDLPGASEYRVVVGYGTPAQKLPVQFDTAGGGFSVLRCKPCAAGTPCEETFDPSLSYSLVQVPCGSPDCPFRGCAAMATSCKFSSTENGELSSNGTVVTDTLTLSPSTTVDNFRFVCLEMMSTGGGGASSEPIETSSGILDLSRDSHSLASRLPSSPDTVAFSYCLPSPSELSSQGFLSLGAARPEHAGGHSVSYTALRSNAAAPSLYFVNLAGLGVGTTNTPISPAGLAGGDSLFSLRTTFTYLRPDLYAAAVRDPFREQMSQYRAAPPPAAEGLDTCYDFTGLTAIAVPVITLEFDGGGGSLELGIEQTMYFADRDDIFSVGCLAFAALPSSSTPPSIVAVIGTMAQAKTEVVYDVRRGKLGFVPYSC